MVSKHVPQNDKYEVWRFIKKGSLKLNVCTCQGYAGYSMELVGKG